jgi:hypothetical protein
MAACVVCNLPVLSPVTLPSGELCHLRCRVEVLTRPRHQGPKAGSRPLAQGHPAIRKASLADVLRKRRTGSS